MKIAVLLLLAACSAHATAQPVLISPTATLGEFGAICDTHRNAPNLNARLSACGSYIVAAVQQIALTRKHPDCWAQIESGKTAPLTLLNAMVKLSKDATNAPQPADLSLRDLVMVAAPACASR